jgi:ADP-ribose pyrophosphatase YjhB (NUDIX family)
VIKEATASTFVFREDPGGVWRTALVWHPRLECWMPSGGHVERDESAAEAALREAREETGLEVHLLPGPAVAVPAGFPHATVCAPWWVVEMRARADNHTREPHVHLDHVFLALAAGGDPAGVAAHETRWFSELEIRRAGGISEDSRLQARDLFPRVMRMAAALTWARLPGREARVSGPGRGPGLDAGA